MNAGIESDSLVALEKQTGQKVWSVTRMPRAWDTPALATIGERTELIVSVQGKIRSFDPATGKELWFCKGINAAELCPSPVVHEGVVHVLGHPRGESMAVRAGGNGDVTDTHVLWRLIKGSNVGSPVFHDGHLYWVNDNKGIAYCVKAETGEVVYEERMTPRPDRIYASPVLVAGRIYYVSRNKGTYVVAAKPRYELLAHNVLNEDASPFTGSPAVVEGKVLLRSDRYLYCIGSKRKADEPCVPFD